MSQPSPSSTADRFDQVVARLRAAGCVFAEDEARLLLAAAADPGDLAELVRRRAEGLPLEQVLGWAEFLGLRIAVEPGVFVPRRRTELLAREAIDAARAAGPEPLVVDLCCGSGAVGAAVLAAVPAAVVHAADIDAAAVRCARRNLPPERVHAGDLGRALPAALRGRVDVLAVNAPYVPTARIPLMPPEARDHEPATALDGGDDGLDLHRRVAAAAPALLAPGGVLLIETSTEQAAGTAAAMTRHGLLPHTTEDPDVAGTVVRGSTR
ncbi:putative protein N(5)-glutamine methyltransferase [Saccharopolyspora gregorii]|uniref:putative protein N(5)-glutamine methyltransferase n=1 Tax=Saccharopolyspora gregorii TaxID=33914 RepID=UPI0021ABCD5A|nr:putative protein N(5)-glutamine methyltransferase [Saccharopolyspora gregorii]